MSHSSSRPNTILAGLALVLITAFTAAAGAHPGPTNSKNCHFSEAQGYHCH